MKKIFLILIIFSFISLGILNAQAKAVAIEKNKKIKAPTSGVYLGLYMNSTGTLSDVAEFEEYSGKKAALYYRHNWWPNTLNNPQNGSFEATTLAERGIVWAMAWAIPTTTKEETKAYAAKIIEGQEDEYIYTMAKQIKDYQYSLMITPFIEFDNPNWSLEPELYKRYHRHVVDIFNEIGVSNVTWFIYNGYEVGSSNKLPLSYYPGDNYVDWVGSSFYYQDERDNISWKTYNHDIWEGFTNKPIFAPEYGPYGEKGTRTALIESNLNKILNNDYQNLHALALIGFDWGNGYYSLDSNECNQWKSLVSNLFFISDVQYLENSLPPSQVNDLIATTGSGSGAVKLSWSDLGNQEAAYYLIKYSQKPIEIIKPSVGEKILNYSKKHPDSTDDNFTYWSNCDEVKNSLPLPTQKGAKKEVTITGLNKGTKYYFGVVAVNKTNYTSLLSKVVSATTNQEEVNPGVSIIYPQGGEVISGYFDLKFKALDKNGGSSEKLKVVIESSLDEGLNWTKIGEGNLVDNLGSGNYLWNTAIKQVELVKIKVTATDPNNSNLSSTVVSSSFWVNNLNLSYLNGFEDNFEVFKVKALKGAEAAFSLDQGKIGNSSLRIEALGILSNGHKGIILEGAEVKDGLNYGEKIIFYLKANNDFHLMVGVVEESGIRYEELSSITGDGSWQRVEINLEDLKLAEGKDGQLDKDRIVALYLYVKNLTKSNLDVTFWIDHLNVKKEDLFLLSPNGEEVSGNLKIVFGESDYLKSGLTFNVWSQSSENQTLSRLVENFSYEGIKSFTWDTTKVKNGDYKIEIEAGKIIGSKTYLGKIESKIFKINNPTPLLPPIVEIISPPADDVWYKNEQETIRWKVFDPNNDPLLIDVWLNKRGNLIWEKLVSTNEKTEEYPLDLKKYEDGIYEIKIEAKEMAFPATKKTVVFEIRRNDQLPPKFFINLVPNPKEGNNEISVYIYTSERLKTNTLKVVLTINEKQETLYPNFITKDGEKEVYAKTFVLTKDYEGVINLEVSGCDLVDKVGKEEKKLSLQFLSLDKPVTATSPDQKIKLNISPYTFKHLKDNKEPLIYILPKGYQEGVFALGDRVVSLNGEDDGKINTSCFYNIEMPDKESYAQEKKIEMLMKYTVDDIKGLQENKLGIYLYNPDKERWIFQERIIDLSGNYLKTDISNLGWYGIFEDKVKPTITISSVINDEILNTANPKIVAFIKDNGSGVNISKIKMYLDKKEVTPKINLESAMFSYQLLYQPVIPLRGGEHYLEIEVYDNVGNESIKAIKFRAKEELAFERVFNSPNPFSHETTMRCEIKKEVSSVNVKIFDISGELVKEFNNAPKTGESQTAYFYDQKWDGKNGKGEVVSNGVYLVLVIAKDGDKSISKVGKIAKILVK